MKKYYLLFLIGALLLIGCQEDVTVNPFDEDAILFTVPEEISQSVLIEKPIFSANQTEETEFCGETYETDIIAGGRHDSGQFTVSNNDENLYITMRAENGWRFWWAFLYVGECNEMPISRKGNPRVTQFNYDPYDATTAFNTEIEFVIPLSEIGENTCIAAYTPMYKRSGRRFLFANSWAQGESEFPGPRLDWYTNYEVSACEEPGTPACETIYLSDSFFGTYTFTQYVDEEMNVDVALIGPDGSEIFTDVARFGRGEAEVNLPYFPPADIYNFVFAFPDGDCAIETYIEPPSEEG